MLRGVVRYVYVCMYVCVSHPHGVVSDALVRASEDRRLDLEQRVRGRRGQTAKVLLGQVDQLCVVHRTSSGNYEPTI